MGSQLVAFVAGIGAVSLGQVLAHSLTSRRERRADFRAALDKAVSAFANGERTLDDLIDALHRMSYDEIRVSPTDPREAPLSDAERSRVEMRAAVFSLRVRLRGDRSPIFRAFERAFSEWEIGFLKCKVQIREDDGWSDDTVRDANGHAGSFRGEFYDVALALAEKAIGPATLKRVRTRG